MDYCSYFDRNYLVRAVAMHASLRRHNPGARWHALCLDQDSASALQQLQLPDVVVLKLSDLLTDLPELAAAQSGRSQLGFYFSLTPALFKWIFRRHPDLETLAYLDADLYFTDSLDELQAAFAGATIGIIEHRFPADMDGSARSGRFNVGLVALRRSAEAFDCLDRWHSQCMEWCEDASASGKFGDQKYLDDWPSRYPGLKILDHPGWNLAPWNLRRHEICCTENRLLADGQPLVFFHFHGFRNVYGRWFYTGFEGFGNIPVDPLRKTLFAPYVQDLRDAARRLRPILPGVELTGSLRRSGPPIPFGLRNAVLLRRALRYWWAGTAIWA